MIRLSPKAKRRLRMFGRSIRWRVRDDTDRAIARVQLSNWEITKCVLTAMAASFAFVYADRLLAPVVAFVVRTFS